MHGVVVVDKPAGRTSHDVVQQVRRALGKRSVGHAGTLDPLATGVLVIAIGEATKLTSYLQAHDKRYETTIKLGVETDSLDADGACVQVQPVPPLDVAAVDRALRAFVGRHPQHAPKLSAIKVRGTALHRRTRRGERIDAPVREVELLEAEVVEVRGDEVRLRLHCGKGFYVRSLARDLAKALGTVGHVVALRRTSSGPFDLGHAVEASSLSRDAVARALVPLSRACEGMIRVDLDEAGVDDASHGRLVGKEHVVSEGWRDAAAEAPLALFGPDGEVVALGRREGDHLRVTRGFVRDA